MNHCSTDQLERLVREIPKVELHLHLEGAIPLVTLFELIQRKRTEPSIRSIADLQKKLTYTDFAHFIKMWIWKNSFIKEEKDFEEIAYDVMRNLSEQNVRFVEAFYSPGDYQEQGLSVQGITECLIAGKKRAYRDFGIQSELIVDLIRGDGVDVAYHRLDEVAPYLGKGVIGIGLGGSEQKFPAIPMHLFSKKLKSEASDSPPTRVRRLGQTLYGRSLKSLGLNGSATG